MHCLRGHARLTFIEDNYRPGNALDVGSGQGAFALWLHRQGCCTTMLDILPAKPPSPDIEVLQMDLYNLDGSTKRYDTILFMEIIEHIQDPGRAIKLCHCLLAPDGVLLITTPWVTTWDKEADHIWRFDQAGIEEMLTQYDARIWSDDTFVYAVVGKTE